MLDKMYEPPIINAIYSMFKGEKKLIQIITGPRQVGKSTAANIIGKNWKGKVFYASADSPLPPGHEWIRHHWETARRNRSAKPLLIIDEVQKVKGWSEEVKALWDEDSLNKGEMEVILLGSSSLLIQKGLSESLSGRFFLHRMHHWQFKEMKDAFNISFDEWLCSGGYPGAVSFLHDESMWKNYIRDSLIETVISRDVLQIQNIAKPALLRHLFMLSASYPAQILSYNKMLGQLVDAGNTTTLAHYVDILDSAFLLSGLELYKIGRHPKKGSSPKLVLWNNALVNALTSKSFGQIKSDTELWGRLVENAVGASLLNELQGLPYELYYWRKNNLEVDFVLSTQDMVWAIEVKSSRMKNAKGLHQFLELYPSARPLIVGGNGMPIEEFFLTPKKDIF